MVIAAGGDVSIVGGAKFILDGAGGNTYFTDDTDTVELYVGGTHAQRWDKGGSGIYELHYNIQSQFSDGTASAPGICFRGGTPSGFYRPNVSGEYSIGFVANGTEKMRLAHNGKFGIGTTSPAKTLHVEESGGDYSAKFKTTHGSAVNGIHLEGTASSSPSGRWFTAKWTPGDEDKAAIAFDGTFYSRANSYGGFSDERLKENIVDAPSSLAELMKLKIKDFNLIGDGVGGTQRGIIAQEFLADGVSIPNFIKTLEPDVTTPDAIEYYTAAYSKLIPWLVQAVQELNAKIDALS